MWISGGVGHATKMEDVLGVKLDSSMRIMDAMFVKLDACIAGNIEIASNVMEDTSDHSKGSAKNAWLDVLSADRKRFVSIVMMGFGWKMVFVWRIAYRRKSCGVLFVGWWFLGY